MLEFTVHEVQHNITVAHSFIVLVCKMTTLCRSILLTGNLFLSILHCVELGGFFGFIFLSTQLLWNECRGV